MHSIVELNNETHHAKMTFSIINKHRPNAFSFYYIFISRFTFWHYDNKQWYFIFRFIFILIYPFNIWNDSINAKKNQSQTDKMIHFMSEWMNLRNKSHQNESVKIRKQKILIHHHHNRNLILPQAIETERRKKTNSRSRELSSLSSQHNRSLWPKSKRKKTSEMKSIARNSDDVVQRVKYRANEWTLFFRFSFCVLILLPHPLLLLHRCSRASRPRYQLFDRLFSFFTKQY